MFVHNINPDLVRIGSFSIRFYGIVYALGFILVTYVLVKAAENKRILNLNESKAVDLVTYGILGAVIGARIWHIITEFEYYIHNPLQMLEIWKGGLAFFGGIAGGIIVVSFFCRKYKIDLIKVLDIVAVPMPFIVFLGRIANFINGEHYGFPVNLPWAVVFPFIDSQPRHPAQLYEALSMLLLFLILLFLRKKKRKTGFIIWSAFMMYGCFRFVTEFFRDTAVKHMVFGLSTAQYLSIVVFVIGIYNLSKTSDSTSEYTGG
ncbi:prolipoprotein diacylglyceryl transferase [Candidatus Woesearchaeota archaeon]|nr:prolipoprotein diacylglyceryl transferase [Candidatus Woesearchaeota archaeon]